MLGMVDVCVKLVLVFEMSDENEVCGAAAGAVHFRVRDGWNDFLKLFVAVEEQLNVLLLGFAVCAVKQLPHNDVMKHGAEHLRCKVISYDGKTTEFAYAYSVFSPVNPLFRRRVRGSQGVFSRRMSGKRRFFILTKRQRVVASLNPFSLRATLSFSKYVFALRKRIIIEII